MTRIIFRLYYRWAHAMAVERLERYQAISNARWDWGTASGLMRARDYYQRRLNATYRRLDEY